MKNLLWALGSLTVMVGCQNRLDFFTQGASEVFQQNTYTFANKIDILWVVDNSLSMANSQTNLINNFSFFIDDFLNRGLDFQMAVIPTDTYLATFSAQPDRARFSDGTDATGRSGHLIVNKNTPNVRNAFLLNIRQGTAGSGDERAFQSFTESLSSPLNAGFVRPGAFLAVVILSDEDDFSHNGSNAITTYVPELHPITSYVDYLSDLTRSSATQKRFNVSTITIQDANCLATLGGSGQKIGTRHMQLADATGGVVGSLCGDFTQTLSRISGRILELITQFPLKRRPVVGTISVVIDSKEVPEDLINGWSYNPTENTISFHGSAVPREGALIAINFQPLEAR